jgi:hypothetical protein
MNQNHRTADNTSVFSNDRTREVPAFDASYVKVSEVLGDPAVRARLARVMPYVRAAVPTPLPDGTPVNVNAKGKDRQALSPDQVPVMRVYGGSFVVAYVIEQAGEITYVKAGDLAAAHLDVLALHDTAMVNLKARARGPNLKLKRQSHMWFVAFDGIFDATLVLLGPIWTQMAAKIEAVPVVCLPERGLLAVCAADAAGGKAQLRGQLEGAKAKGKTPIADGLFEWRDGVWTKVE